jgi:hypothetical protein
MQQSLHQPRLLQWKRPAPSRYLGDQYTRVRGIQTYELDRIRANWFDILEDNSSDSSSICHSPGWDDAETKKQRKIRREAKDMRRKEKEKTAKDIRKAEHTHKKLVKVQPANQVPRAVIAGNHSSAPTLPPLSRIMRRHEIIETVLGGADRLEPTKSDVSMQGTKDVAETSSSPRPRFQRLPPSRAKDGFIGGLKLRVADQAAVDGARGEVSTSVKDLYDSGDGPESGRPRGPITDGYQNDEQLRRSIGVETRGPSHIRNSNPPGSGSVSALPTSSSPGVSPVTPIMERTVKKKQNDKNTIQNIYSSSEYRSDASPVPREHPQPKAANTMPSSRPISEFTESESRNRLSRARGRSPERPPLSYRGPLSLASESSRGTYRAGSYVGTHRQQSRDRSVSDFEDENRVVAEAPSTKSRRRSWSIASLTHRSRRWSTSKLGHPTESIETPNASNDADHPTSQPLTADPPPSPDLLSVPGLRTSLNIPTPPSFKGFKYVARAAFSRHSYVPPSPSSAAASSHPSKERVHKLRTKTSNGSLHNGGNVSEQRPGASADATVTPVIPNWRRALQQVVTDEDLPQPQYLERNSPRIRMPRFGQYSPSSTNTDSSGNAGDETTDASSPSGSRPQSEKGYMREKTSRTDSQERSTLQSSPHIRPLMSLGSPVDDAARTHEGMRRAAIPIDTTNDEDQSNSSAKRSTASVSFLQPCKKTGSNNVTQSSTKDTTEATIPRPSSRSISPDLHDLSFLPDLKHQPLVTPSKDKGKSKEKKTVSRPKSPPNSKKKPFPKPTLLLPPPPQLTTIPTPSARLHAARQTLSLPPILPAVSSPSIPKPATDPIAKMLVICCSCRYFHDMPSKIYACMAKPDDVVEDRELGVSGVVSTAVKCPWCAHGMSVRCCEGWAAVVALRERLH